MTEHEHIHCSVLPEEMPLVQVSTRYINVFSSQAKETQLDSSSHHTQQP